MSDALQLYLLEQELLQEDSPGARLGWEPGTAAGGRMLGGIRGGALGS